MGRWLETYQTPEEILMGKYVPLPRRLPHRNADMVTGLKPSPTMSLRNSSLRIRISMLILSLLSRNWLRTKWYLSPCKVLRVDAVSFSK